MLARCNDQGELVADGGRVEVRYRRDDGRAYRAAVRNLVPAKITETFPDDHCAEAEAPAEAKAKAKGGRGTGKTGGKKGASATAGSPPREVPEGDEILVYADGACSGNPGPAGLGVVWLDGEGQRELSEFLGRATNNVAELTAILRAAERAAGLGRPLRIYTDSSYSIGVLTKGWKAKANIPLIAEVKSALAKLDEVSLIHVRGHAGVPLNERADELARVAVMARLTAGWVDVRQNGGRPRQG